MAYSLEFSPAVKAALRGIPGLSRSGRIELYAHVIDSLRNHGDDFPQQSGPPRRAAADGRSTHRRLSAVKERA
jgi:hypothetical protein